MTLAHLVDILHTMSYYKEGERYFFTTHIDVHEQYNQALIYVDEELAKVLPFDSHKRLRVDGDIHGFYISGAFMPYHGRWFLQLSKKTMKEIGVGVGDVIEFNFTIADQDAVDIPNELRDALEINPSMKELWDTLTPGKKRGYSYMVTKAKLPATKQKRINAIFLELEQLKKPPKN